MDGRGQRVGGREEEKQRAKFFFFGDTSKVIACIGRWKSNTTEEIQVTLRAGCMVV